MSHGYHGEQTKYGYMAHVRGSKKKCELAKKGQLFYVSNGWYVRASVGLVVAKLDSMSFFTSSKQKDYPVHVPEWVQLISRQEAA